DHPENLTDLHIGAGAVRDLAQDAGLRGSDLDVDLVGRELHERIADVDGVAFLLPPFRAAAADDRCADLGDNDIRRHLGTRVGGYEGRRTCESASRRLARVWALWRALPDRYAQKPLQSAAVAGARGAPLNLRPDSRSAGARWPGRRGPRPPRRGTGG